MAAGNSSATKVRAQLLAAHDAITAAGFAVACVFIALIACTLPYEIVTRYFFNAPTDWTSPIVSYFLVTAIFLAMPELTRQSAHVVITTLLEALEPKVSAKLQKLVQLLAAGACLLATWFSADETLGQFMLGIHTIPPMSIPKWIVTIVIPYGMFSSAIYFLRQFAGERSSSAALGSGT